MKKKIIILAILNSLSVSAFAKEPQDTLEVKADVNAGCFLDAANINFGNLQMPLNNQSATSNISLKCSKGANVSLGITYAANASVSAAKYTYQISADNDYGQWVEIYEKGVKVGVGEGSSFACQNNREFGSAAVVFSPEIAPILGYNWNSLGTFGTTKYKIIPNISLCSIDYRKINFANLDNLLSEVVDAGLLTGLSAGEQIIYSLEMPNSSSNWDMKNVFKVTTSGETETIPMKAKIERASNPTHRMTPDTYQSTLTVVLSY